MARESTERRHGTGRSSREDEQRLIAGARDGDRSALEQLVRAYEPAIGGLVREYRNHPGVERAELMQQGVVGLLRALERYEPQRGVPFWGYASWWVRRALQDLVSELTRSVALSDRALLRLARINDVRNRYLREHNRYPTAAELAEATGSTREQVDSLLAVERRARGFDTQVLPGEGGATVGDMVVDPDAEEAYAKVLDASEAASVRMLTDGLGDRERDIVHAHYGLGRPQETLREIGERLGISIERVRQIEARALETVREAAQSMPPLKAP